MPEYLYMLKKSTMMVHPWDDVTTFFDFSDDAREMSQDERNLLIRFGENTTHQVVSKEFYENECEFPQGNSFSAGDVGDMSLTQAMKDNA